MRNRVLEHGIEKSSRSKGWIMKETSLLFLQSRLSYNKFMSFKEHSAFKIGVISFFSLVFWGGIFVLLYRGLRFFEIHIPHDFFAMMLDYLFSIFYFALFLMLTFSSTVIAFSVFFHARETKFLMTNPLPFSSLFLYKLTETLVFASWAIFFLGLPVCFSYGIQQGVSILFYPLLIFSFIPFVVIPCVIGALACFFIATFLAKFKKYIILFLITLVLASLAYLIVSIYFLKYEAPKYTAAWFLGMLEYLNFAKHPILPSSWMTKAMFALSSGDYKEYIFQMLLIISSGLFFASIAYLFASVVYHRAWSTIHSAKSKKNIWKFQWIRKALRSLFFLSPKDRVFLEKDIKIFLRDPLQWSQFLILIGLLLLYIVNLRTLRYDQHSTFWKHTIATLNLTATSLTVCTFASRFIFPMLSLEGKRFWLLGIMPTKKKNILLTKFVFAVITLLITSELLILLSCQMLRLPISITIFHLITMFAITIGVSGLSVGIGAIYPNFKEDSPSKIVSGFGGTLNLVLSLLFVLTMVSLQFFPAYLVFKRIMIFKRWYIWIISGAIITIIACVLPLYIGIQYFKKMEN